MSKAKVHEFLTATRGDDQLRSGFEEQGGLDEIVEYAASAGYEFSPVDFHEGALEYFEENDIELSEEQLEMAAGGVIVTIWNCGQCCGEAP